MAPTHATTTRDPSATLAALVTIFTSALPMLTEHTLQCSTVHAGVSALCDVRWRCVFAADADAHLLLTRAMGQGQGEGQG